MTPPKTVCQGQATHESENTEQLEYFRLFDSTKAGQIKLKMFLDPRSTPFLRQT